MQYLETYSKAPLSRRLVKTEFLQYKVYNCSSTIPLWILQNVLVHIAASFSVITSLWLNVTPLNSRNNGWK